MNNVYRTGVLLALVWLITVVPILPLHAAEYEKNAPGGIISRYAEKTVSALQNEAFRQKETLEPLRRQLFNQLAPIIDFELMTRMAMGPQARQTSPEKLEELRQVFKPLVVRLYTDRLFKYMVEPKNPWTLNEIRIKNQQFRGGGQYALVSTLAKVEKNGTKRELAMDFKMIDRDGNWKVYDLVFENVSLVENYRSQFTSILANGTVDELIQKLRTKLEGIRPEDAEKSVTSDSA
jgi:phospholipid transport system substrate-binding protein